MRRSHPQQHGGLAHRNHFGQPDRDSAGGSSTLSVSATNATKVMVTGSDGSTYTLPATGGTQTVNPAASTTYTATASGSSGSVTATVAIAVSVSADNPTVTITAAPSSIAAGGSSTLTVAAMNATQVTISGSDGNTYSLGAAGGTQAVTPAATTTVYRYSQGKRRKRNSNCHRHRDFCRGPDSSNRRKPRLNRRRQFVNSHGHGNERDTSHNQWFRRKHL